MAPVHVSSAAVQVVYRGNGKHRVTSAALQVVSQGTPRRVRVSSSTMQVVVQTPTSRARVGHGAAQIVVRVADNGAIAKVTSGSLNVVWSKNAPSGIRQRSWTFDFDGHNFYVLDLGSFGALVYDTLTGQWTKFVTEGFNGGWNFKNGFDWLDGKMVVGGHDGNGTLLRMTPQSYLDEGWRPVVYEVRGILPLGGTKFFRQYSLRMIGSSGVLADDVSPVMKMQFSDDRGETWSPEYTIELTPNTRQRIEFRSLGAFTAPGRIFRIYDQGGIQFLAAVEADIGGTDGGPPA